MSSLPILVGIVIGFALASAILGTAFMLLCAVILAGLKALPPRNPFKRRQDHESNNAWRNDRKPCRRFFSVHVQRGGLIKLGRASL